MRGKDDRDLVFCVSVGITPAYAGKSSKQNFDFFFFQDHPRLCGEKSTLSCIVEFSLGSPPPMRGKVLRMPEKSPQKRITPAYAGKREFGYYVSKICTDHPRLCGEKRWCILCDASMIGSPPPMRGKGKTCSSTTSRTRITPAYAGKRGASNDFC